MSTGARAQPAGEQAARPPAQRKVAGFDLTVLTGDHALTSTPEGRELVGWLSAHAVDAGEWVPLVDAVPLARRAAVATTARACAQVWADFAEALERRPTTG